MYSGGVLTLLFTALAVWRIPALMTFRDDQPGGEAVALPQEDEDEDETDEAKNFVLEV
jgi:hypothetical protein